MVRRAEVTAAISAIYDTVLDQGAWPRAIDRVRRLVDGVGGTVCAIENETGRIKFWQTYVLEADGSEYAQHLHRINPRTELSLIEPPGVPCWDYRVITEPEIDRHEFYDGIHRLSGVRYFIGARPVEIDGVSLFTSVERTKKRGHVDEHDIALYAEIAPHYANAFRLAGRLAAVKTEASLFHLLDQQRDEGLILLDAKGRVVQTNADADRLLARNDGLWLQDRTLKAWKAADDRSLRNIVAGALETASRRGFGGGSTLSLPRPSGALSYLLRIMPWPAGFDDPERRPAVAVLVRDPEERATVTRPDLIAYFGLTPREAALADLLSRGESLPDASLTLGISHNTGRTHLRNIFRKTGTANQGQLLRLILAAP